MALKLQIMSVKGAIWVGWCKQRLMQITHFRKPGVILHKTYVLPKGIMAQIISSDICDIIRIWGGVAAGFICHPRSDSFPGGVSSKDGKPISAVYAYPLVDNDHGSVVLTPNGSNPVAWTDSRDVENYGNNDWLGDDGTVLSWRGPSGRDLPFDFRVSVPGFTVGDGEDNLGIPFYTVFQPLVYKEGDVYGTAPKVGVTPPKVLGAAFVSDKKGNTFLISIINNSYQNMVNPSGRTGGFFDEAWLNGGSDKLYDADKNPGGWRRIGYIGSGRSTNNWFFSGNGKAAVNDNRTMAVNDDLTIVTFGTVIPVYGSRVNHQSPNSWGFTESGQWKGNYPDYAKEVETGLVVKLSGSEGSNLTFNTNVTNADLIVYNNGVPTVEVFTITLGSGSADPWGMGLAIVPHVTVPGVNCGCSAPVDVWTRKGFNPAGNCVTDGDRRTVTATRTISCAGVGDAVATVTVDYGANQATGMGWIAETSVHYDNACCAASSSECYIGTAWYYPSTAKYLYWDSLIGVNPTIATCPTSYGCENACPPESTCHYSRVTPIDPALAAATGVCGFNSNWIWATTDRGKFYWGCLASVDPSLWYSTIYGNAGPTPNSVTLNT